MAGFSLPENVFENKFRILYIYINITGIALSVQVEGTRHKDLKLIEKLNSEDVSENVFWKGRACHLIAVSSDFYKKIFHAHAIGV